MVVSQKKEKLLNREKLEKAFKMFDMDANGQISRGELQEIMGGVDVDVRQWTYILDECDKNKDGQISMGEFIEMMQNYD